ncbi:MAG: DUF885 domain-containing protein [Chloroflexi bacterium]|nr:DUF885 domain-containing protein [Chloroflexota bacterium]
MSESPHSPVAPIAETQADRRFEQLVQGRFERLVRDYPIFATYLGIHTEDHRLANGTRDAVEQGIKDDRAFLAAVEALDTTELSEGTRFERELALHAVRRSLFDDEEHRTWERRTSAMDEVGDGLFLILARDFAPLPERLDSMTARLEQAPRVTEEHKTRLGDRPVRLWNELELDSARQMPSLFDEIVAAGRGAWHAGSAELRRLEAASDRAKAAIVDYAGWLSQQLGRAGDDFPLGRERYDRLVELRAFDGLSTDQILAIGEQQLADCKKARADVARRIDPDVPEPEVLDRVKSDHPASFEEALEGYRDAMFRARQHILDRDLATLPPGERLSVIPTPEYLRHLMPFAAYFQPPKFDERPAGIYVVTPSVDGDPGAMREHNRSSISNTSIHEAYPGHHLQLSAAITQPSITRLMVDAPEFVEGWGMYCEQMMREQGFDDSPQHLLIMYTDAIWRACRIILDVRLHRGEIGVPEAIDFLVEHTGFERPNATAEVNRYTYTPTYQLSYLLGKVMLLRLREDERRRLGDAFSLKRFHDTLLYAGSLPISFQRRVLQRELPAAG